MDIYSSNVYSCIVPYTWILQFVYRNVEQIFYAFSQIFYKIISEKCSNCKCFGIRMHVVFVCSAKTHKKQRKVKLDKISHITQNWTGQNDWHLVKIVRNNCFSSMWCFCNLYLDTPVASNRCGQYSNHTCNQLKRRKVDNLCVVCHTEHGEKKEV